jgi:hypothetical protein
LYKRILVVCPANAITAGPEAIHQLVFDLNRLGFNAVIVYHPFHYEYLTPEPYRKYDVKAVLYEDISNELIIFPEIYTTLALKVKHAKSAIWWMSVNNYTCMRYGNPFRDRFRYFKNLIRGKRPWLGINALKPVLHFAQSHYAEKFLANHGIYSESLSDPIPVYTALSYLDSIAGRLKRGNRDNIILYNPHKGKKVTEKLKSSFPDWIFKPLQGYGRDELADIFLNSKIYMDFGHHPGKDRLPREAAIHGCCVITGLYGSALNPIDVPINDRYKLNNELPDFVAKFGVLASDIFNNFEKHFEIFQHYRDVIAKEQVKFDQQILKIFS